LTSFFLVFIFIQYI